ncbi:uncharacterized protein N0V89_000208 [Didymosphaeria variabile]|uniref:Uncharacterized protein n=1 Tax=Didymosphaeria variabile TaxID=1932322 RepID=A0A9W8XU85_9PLEO|nr:uncharacterized protein N0V89_000208 [Didymosphaeria variabile]KAJ4359653.1 hypothetical protein N0V89_000208 [Didymosphaeria variabile]
MRIFVAFIGAVAALAVPVAARALPEAGVAAVVSSEVTSGLVATEAAIAKRSSKVPDGIAGVSPDEASPDTHYCGYAYSEHGLRGYNVALVVDWDTHTDGHFRSYIISGNCDCEFRGKGVGNQENFLHIKGPGQGELPWDAWFFFCKLVGHTKRDQVEDSAVVASPASPDHDETIYCGYAYTEKGLRGENIALQTDMVLQKDKNFKSVIISGECLCTFHTGKDGAEGPLQKIKGPVQGDLQLESFRAYCVQDGFKKGEQAKDLGASTLAPAPAPRSDDTIYCGYAYTAPNLRGEKYDLAADAVVRDNIFKSYIISGQCKCDFIPYHDDHPSETIKGPTQGNLIKEAREVWCRQDGSRQRDEIQVLAAREETVQ